jgi:dihydrofolate synthase / folylpolyglutamate synthase
MLYQTPVSIPDVGPEDHLEWLFTTQTFGVKLGLSNMRRLLHALGNPEQSLSYLHVAGTNGKGSTCSFAASLFRELGYKTGLFTSPHLVDYRERITVDQTMIPQADLNHYLESIRLLVDFWKPHPTFFEITLAVALMYFRDQECSRVVLETGLGGRLDSTNVVTPIASAITAIDYDHKRLLGNKLSSIAMEKAGIIKPGVPVVAAPQRPEAAKVLKKVARANASPLIWVDAPWDKAVSLSGEIQKWNAATAWHAVTACGENIPRELADKAFSQTVWPARFQKCLADRVIIDGAHNPASARVLANTWNLEFPGEKAVILFSALNDKDWKLSIEPLLSFADDWILTKVKPARALTLEELQNITKMLERKGKTAHLVESPEEALALARAKADASGRRLVVAGSLYLAGEILALLESRPFQPSEQ